MSKQNSPVENGNKLKPFRFKQFQINQGESAMKVGTDGVLLGAWAPINNANNILDVGTGTGLIALMIAQRRASAERGQTRNWHIDAIEIDEMAEEEARTNFKQCPWASQLKLHHQDFRQYSTSTDKQYDLIVSNPPFFNSGNTINNEARNMARNTVSLSYKTIIESADKLLTPNGAICMILPVADEMEFKKCHSAFSFYLKKRLLIYPRKDVEPKRFIAVISRGPSAAVHEEMILEISRGNYTAEYQALCRDFYLKF